MTKVTRRTSKDTATIWPFVSSDPYGQVVYGIPYTISCTYEQGSSKQYRDAMGQMYIPKSIYWYELPSEGKPTLKDYIAFGDQTSVSLPVDADNAEVIKNSVQQSGGVLNETPDIMVMT